MQLKPLDNRGLQEYLYRHPWRHFLLYFLVMFAVKRMMDDFFSIWISAHSATNAYVFSFVMAGVFMYTQRKTIEKRLDKEARLGSKNPTPRK